MPESHYFDPDPTGPSRPGRVTLRLDGLSLDLATDRGVFAGTASQVDPGTLALLKASPAPPAEGHLLDLGCGYGPIACALAARSPRAEVWAVDVNQRALALAAANAAAHGLGNVHACEPAGVPEGLIFDGIWSNPPIRIGKAALHDLLDMWLPRLRAGAGAGAGAWLVVQRHLGADSLVAWLEENGRQVRRVASKRGYRILQVTG